MAAKEKRKHHLTVQIPGEEDTVDVTIVAPQDDRATARRLVAASSRANNKKAPTPTTRCSNPGVVLHAAQTQQRQLVGVCGRFLRLVAWAVVFALYILYQVVVGDVHTMSRIDTAVKKMLFATLPEPRSDLNEAIRWLQRDVVAPAWRDPVCGDGVCEQPYETRGTTGPGACPADCGADRDVSKAIVRVASDFRGFPRISSQTLQKAARWNLCQRDDERARAGGTDLCYFENDVKFEDDAQLQAVEVELPHGLWYLTLDGDPAGRTAGFLVDADVLASRGLLGAYNATRELDSRSTGDVKLAPDATSWGT